MSYEYDPSDEHNNDDENEEYYELDDTDVVINEYDDDEDHEAHNDDEDEDNDLVEDIEQIDFEKSLFSVINPKFKKTSRISRMSKYEYCVLYGKLAEYIQQSKLYVPEGLLNDPEVLSGDIFRISRCWIKNRKEFPIPLNLDRILFGHNVEKINPSELETDDYYAFLDDEDDTDRFYYNFRDEHYDTSA